MSNLTRKIPLSVTLNYVPDWGVWEMFREFAQNALDANGSIVFEPNKGKILITNTGKLIAANLLYGGGDKANDTTKRGMHGEGFKNAMLVAVRENIKLQITSGNELWESSVEHSNLFKTECLHVTITEYPIDLPNVTVVLEGLSPEQIQLCQERYLPVEHNKEAHFGNSEDGYGFNPEDKDPTLFIGGLFVCPMPKSWWEDATYVYSYNLPPKTIKLDRDRNTVDEYKLQEVIATILIKNAEIDLMAELASDNALDIQGYSEYTAAGCYATGSEELNIKDTLAAKALELFYEKNGKLAYPVREGISQRELRFELIHSKGFTPIIVSNKLYSLFDKNLIIGLGADTIQKLDVITFLTDLLKNKSYCLRGKARKDIEVQLAYLNKYGVND